MGCSHTKSATVDTLDAHKNDVCMRTNPDTGEIKFVSVYVLDNLMSNKEPNCTTPVYGIAQAWETHCSRRCVFS